MNGNDLMTALSGLDPKFIDEAAYELHDINAEAADTVAAQTSGVQGAGDGKADVVDITSKRRNRFRRTLYIVLPSVAAILLIVGVAFPAIMRISKNESAATAMETAAPMSDEAAAEEAAAEESAEAAADEVAEAEAAEDTAAAGEEADLEKKEAGGQTLTTEAVKPERSGEAAEAAEAADAEEAAAPMAENSEATYGPEAEAAAEEAEETAEEAEEAEVYDFTIDSAEYKNGKLTLQITGSLPDDLSDTNCTIFTVNAGRPAASRYAGKVSDLLDLSDPLTFDLTALKLTPGTYRLVIGPEIDFTVKASD